MDEDQKIAEAFAKLEKESEEIDMRIADLYYEPTAKEVWRDLVKNPFFPVTVVLAVLFIAIILILAVLIADSTESEVIYNCENGEIVYYDSYSSPNIEVVKLSPVACQTIEAKK